MIPTTATPNDDTLTMAKLREAFALLPDMSDTPDTFAVKVRRPRNRIPGSLIETFLCNSIEELAALGVSHDLSDAEIFSWRRQEFWLEFPQLPSHHPMCDCDWRCGKLL